MMADNRGKSSKKGGARKNSGAAAQTKLTEGYRALASKAVLSKRTVWIGALIASPIVIATGLGLLLVREGVWTGSAPDGSVGTFVGSEKCAGCHQAQAQLW